MRVEAATRAASLMQYDLPGPQHRANSQEMFSVPATDQVVRARPTTGSDRGFARSILFRYASLASAYVGGFFGATDFFPRLRFLSDDFTAGN